MDAQPRSHALSPPQARAAEGVAAAAVAPRQLRVVQPQYWSDKTPTTYTPMPHSSTSRTRNSSEEARHGLLKVSQRPLLPHASSASSHSAKCPPPPSASESWLANWKYWFALDHLLERESHSPVHHLPRVCLEHE
jgi:hypothetical protein